MLHGSAEAREMVVNNEFYYQEPHCSKADATALQRANTYKFHVLLTTFEMATKDIRVLSKIQWQVRVVTISVT
jgi:chromodomain-helicase-DNA-binding protein 7